MFGKAKWPFEKMSPPFSSIGTTPVISQQCLMLLVLGTLTSSTGEENSHVINFQVVVDAMAGSLDVTHARKVMNYNSPNMEVLTSNPPVFSSFIIS